MTYTALVTLVQDMLENAETSFVANIPALVQQAEAFIYGRVRTPDQRKQTTGTVSAATFSAPADFVEPLMLYLTVTNAPLIQKEESWLTSVWGTTTGTPLYYAIRGATGTETTIRVAPVPSGSTSYTLDYIGTPTSIVTASTTWLSLNFPHVLLYGTLVQGEIYNKGDRDYKTLFEESLGQLMRSAEGLMLRDEYRNPVIREGVAN